MSEDNPVVMGSPGGKENHTPITMQSQPMSFLEPPCSPIPHSSPGGSEIHPTPSPAGKRFMGIYGNARNDIYMKSLMNSPYHKSYTPFSATPGYSPGPLYQTTAWNGDSSPVRSVAPSPKSGGSRPSSTRKFVTPKGVVNPFETGIDDLERPTHMSPGFFTVTSTPASEKCFRWSIEHIAELNPADIDEMPVKQCISSNSHLMQTVMDFEIAPTTLANRFTDNILTSSLCETHDFSSDIDYQDETHLQTNSSNQDTGYQTASLQSTNPESVSLHTNLTNQFGSLPFNVTNQEIGLQNLSQISTSRDKAPPIINLTKQFFEEGEELKTTEGGRRGNRSFDKQSLPKQNLFAQNMFTSDESDTETTPKNQRLVVADDSAFRENSSLFDLDSGSMEVDTKKEGAEFYPNEKAVLSRARQALALANSLYPQDTWSSKTEVNIMDDASQMSEGDAKSTKLPASEFAFNVLQKAGQDLAKFEHMFSGN